MFQFLKILNIPIIKHQINNENNSLENRSDWCSISWKIFSFTCYRPNEM